MQLVLGGVSPLLLIANDWMMSQSIALEAVRAPVSSVVTCLGVQFDSHLTFTPHVQGLIVVSTIFGSYGTYEAVVDN